MSEPLVYAIPTDTCYGLACGFSDVRGYEQIFTLKGREKKKPLAIVVETFDDIEKMIFITRAQREFLEKYPFPFTILGQPRHIPVFLDPNLYEFFGIRVAEICLSQEIRASLLFPLFLTSANQSGEKELFTSEAIHEVFPHSVEILGEKSAGKPASNIFRFIGDTTDISYTRQNYFFSS